MHIRQRIYLIVSIIIMTTSFSFGQSPTNLGLTYKQDKTTLPKSAVSAEVPIRKPKEQSVTILKPVSDNEWLITGGWEMAEATKVIASEKSLFDNELNTSQWYNATVPGTVLTTLVDQGVYPNPYFGLNNLAIPESLCRTDWWYRTTFKLPAGSDLKTVWLILNGINYQAEIWLNGKELGTIKGAFIRGEFNATDLIKSDKENILAVHILPPPNPGIPHEQSPTAGRGPNGGQLCLDGPTFISSEGWDWVPGIRDRNIGIWQNVSIRLTNAITLGDAQVITSLPLPDTTSAKLLVKTEVINHSSKPQQFTLTGVIDNITFSQQVNLNQGERKQVSFSSDAFPQLKIKKPLLWWPNGYGKPNLYTLKLTVANGDLAISDSKTTRFGIRELSYELSVDAPDKKDWRVEYTPTTALKSGMPLFDNINRRTVGDGVSISKLREGVNTSLFTELQDKSMAPYLVIKVNGVRIFCKGGNWGMDDAMKRVSRKALEPYFQLHKDAHFNMVRNWTGESTEEIFYDLCDEYGLLVWNDFWLSTEGYNQNVNDDQLFLDNARDVVRRFRNHPSIAIWCPRNEGYAPKFIEEGLASMLATEDGTRHYQPNSRYLNLRPSGPWNYFKDGADYFRNNAKGFNTELGSPSVPTAVSMRNMMAKEDVWPISDVWYYHDLHFGQMDYCHSIDTLYGPSKTLEDFCKKAQMVNYDSHRAMFESWNSKMWNNTSGLLLWMTHPAWPSTVWQVYSWDYETFGSYFGSQKACEPVHIQMNLHDNKVVIINTSLKGLEDAKINLEIFDLTGKSIFKYKQISSIKANKLTECFTPTLPLNLPNVYLARLELTDKKGIVISQNEYWKKSPNTKTFIAFNQLPAVELVCKMVKQEKPIQEKYEFVITNTTHTPAIGIKLNLYDVTSHQFILPAYFSDGYFTLLPGESRHLSVTYEGKELHQIISTGYNIINKFNIQ